MKSIEVLVMVVLGGMGSMLGSVLSATVLTALPEMRVPLPITAWWSTRWCWWS
jgi:ABC-type branched-subunit amino acid transport system permease subunit